MEVPQQVLCGFGSDEERAVWQPGFTGREDAGDRDRTGGETAVSCLLRGYPQSVIYGYSRHAFTVW